MPPSGRGYAISPERTRTWGTEETVRLSRRCFATLAQTWPRSSVVVGDLSARSGGRASRHRSHQSGRDIDVWYPARGRLDGTVLVGVREQWTLTRCLLDTGRVKLILMAPPVMSALRATVERAFRDRPGKRARYLSQFASIVIPDRAHWSHMHVRFKCPKEDLRCRD